MGVAFFYVSRRGSAVLLVVVCRGCWVGGTSAGCVAFQVCTFTAVWRGDDAGENKKRKGVLDVVLSRTPCCVLSCLLLFGVGGFLLSHNLPVAVPSALAGLASGFGMGPGVSLLL